MPPPARSGAARIARATITHRVEPRDTAIDSGQSCRTRRGRRRSTWPASVAEAHNILLMVSSSFLTSDDCTSLTRTALARQAAGKATFIPVIRRHSVWQDSPFGHLKPRPGDGKPVLSFADRDAAWLDVVTRVNGCCCASTSNIMSYSTNVNGALRKLI